MAGIFVLGAFSKKATNIGAYAGFIASALVVINLKYNHPKVTSWSYSIITIGVSCAVGYIVSSIHRVIKNIDYNNIIKATIHGKNIA